MISLKATLEAIKTKLNTHETKIWYISDMAMSSAISGKVGYRYSPTITWANIPTNATNIKFIPTYMKWLTPLQTNSITKSGTKATASVDCVCVETTGDGYIGGVLMYQLS